MIIHNTKIHTWRLASFGALLAGLTVTGCAPVFSDFQSARLLDRGKVEVTPSLSSVSFTDSGESGHVQYNGGLQVGAGISEFLEMRAGCYRVFDLGDEVGGVNVLGFGPKFSIVRDRVAFVVPVGFAFGADIDQSETWAFHPTVLFTSSRGNFEITPSAKALIPLSDDGGDTLFAFNLGAGIRPGESGVTLRPELGMLVNPGESGVFWSFGAGISYRFGGVRP